MCAWRKTRWQPGSEWHRKKERRAPGAREEKCERPRRQNGKVNSPGRNISRERVERVHDRGKRDRHVSFHVISQRPGFSLCEAQSCRSNPVPKPSLQPRRHEPHSHPECFTECSTLHAPSAFPNASLRNRKCLFEAH